MVQWIKCLPCKPERTWVWIPGIHVRRCTLVFLYKLSARVCLWEDRGRVGSLWANLLTSSKFSEKPCLKIRWKAICSYSCLYTHKYVPTISWGQVFYDMPRLSLHWCWGFNSFSLFLVMEIQLESLYATKQMFYHGLNELSYFVNTFWEVCYILADGCPTFVRLRM